MKREHITTAAGGVDVSKRWLDAAAHGLEGELRVPNNPDGHAELAGWFGSLGVGRVGLEASGGYEQALRLHLEAQDIEVVVHQPQEVRQFARLKRLKAKSDRIDARLIAWFTAWTERSGVACDARLAELAERLTAYDQISDLAAQLKTCVEHVTLADLKALYRAQIEGLKKHKRLLLRQVLDLIAADPELAQRTRLLQSLAGFGPLISAAIAVRMPELGKMKRGQAASLIGVAPFDRDSGEHKGKRFIGGGRSRPRRLLYLAALAARRHDRTFKTFNDRLLAKGKPPKVAIVAVMRKLIEAANLILARGQPWIVQTSN